MESRQQKKQKNLFHFFFNFKNSEQPVSVCDKSNLLILDRFSEQREWK